MTIVSFVLPRLRRFKETTCGYPSELTEEEWADKLSKMINAFEKYENNYTMDKKSLEEIDEGLRLFAEYFYHLWS
jgi:hypothetical protein